MESFLLVFSLPVKFGRNAQKTILVNCHQLFSRTYKRGRLNHTQTFDAGERHEPSDETRTFRLGLNM